MSTIKRVTLPLLFLSIASPMALADSGWSIGAEYSEGDYGTTETTTSWYLPVAWRYAQGNVSAGITVPYVSVSGSALVSFDGRPLAPSGTSGGGAGAGAGVPTTTSRSVSGLGDVVLSGGYQLLGGEGDSTWLNIGASAKLGTADEVKGLGSGENDYTLQLEAAKGMLYGFVGYTLIGDTALVDYNDVASMGVALDIPLDNGNNLGLEYFTEQAALDGGEDISQATLSLGGDMDGGFGYSLFYTAGLSDSSADSIIGLNISSAMK